MSEDAEHQVQLKESRQMWDRAAATFDNEPDHGLLDRAVRAAWKNLLKALLPKNEGHVLDIGCGTGSISLLLAEFGFDMTGVDLSPAMIAVAEAKAKAAGYGIEFHTMDAAYPQFPPQQFDVIVCRHLLWALPELSQVLQRWADLLKPGGHLLLIEGFWHTGGGLHMTEILDAMPAAMSSIVTQDLSDQEALWGGPVTDERYVIHAMRKEHKP